MNKQGEKTHTILGCRLGVWALRVALTDHLQDQLAYQHLHGHVREILIPLPVPTQEGGRRYVTGQD